MATKANLVIDQGTSYSVTLNLTDENGDAINLINYSANSQIRKWYSSSNSVAFATSLDITEGTVTLTLTANQTNILKAGRYVYDVELYDTSSNTYSRILEGIVTVTPQVTR